MLFKLPLLALCITVSLAAPAVESPNIVCPLRNGCIINPHPCGCCFNGITFKRPCLLAAEPAGCPYYPLITTDGAKNGSAGDIKCCLNCIGPVILDDAIFIMNLRYQKVYEKQILLFRPRRETGLQLKMSGVHPRIYANSTAQQLPRTLFTILEPSRIMRLLQYNNDGDVGLTEFFGGDIPKKYAILSHTWEGEEVTFEDLRNGTGTTKAGYEKIRFCAEQALRDGLQYFWVDTCCIDKSNNAELTEAVNSMFRWYRESTKCYVYLSDVSWPAVDSDDLAWEAAFRISKWFTRGWMLQELIAPAKVEFFFPKEGKLLDSKASLEKLIQEITKIPVQALRGNSFSGFSPAERFFPSYMQVDRVSPILASSATP